MSRWDDGHIVNNAGPRMVVYRPDYPKAGYRGRVYRAHVVWWLVYKKVPPRGHVIHHINHNSLDDSPSNLQLLSRSEHSAHHHEKHPPVKMVCPICSCEFRVLYTVISQHLKEGRKYGQRFCSKRCRDQSMVGQRGFSRRGMTPAKVRALRALRTKGASVRHIAAQYGLSKSAVYAILRGQNWGDVK